MSELLAGADLVSQLKNKVSLWAERFEAFSLRERALIALAVITLMFMLFDATLLSREEMRQKNILEAMQTVNQQSAAVTLKIQEMNAALQGGEAKHIRARTQELRHLLVNLARQEKALTVEFIPPEKMAGVLRDMLSAEGGLHLTQLESLAAEPLFPAEENENNAEEQPELRTQIFKHGMRIVFEGDFFRTLAYLKALEALPWRFYWDNVEYQVLDYPRARVAITVHTLSLHEGWIGV
jgi:MSHA biogenesis protein MshJ